MSRFTAHQLPKHRGPAAWSAILPHRQTGPSLKNHLTADFVVVGAGFAGLSAARRLLQLNPGAAVVVLEAGQFAEGASGRNSGFMIDLPHELSSENYAGDTVSEDKHIIRLNRHAIAFAENVIADYNINPAWFEKAGKVNGAASEKAHHHNQTYSKHLQSLEESSTMLDEKDMFELTGSRHYRSGLYTPGTVLLQPAGYIRGFATGLQKQAQLFECSPVTAIQKTGVDWKVTTPEGSVTASTVILANNGQLESFGFARGRLMHIFLYAVMTPDLDQQTLSKLGGAPSWGITPSDPMGTTLRKIASPLGGNRIVTRTCASFRPKMQASAADLKRAAHVMQGKFESRFPQLKGVTMEHAWAGHLCLSQNNVSVMKKLDEGLFAACCQNGLGTTRGTLTGIGAAELASDHSSDITQRFAGESEPKKLPPTPISTWGANTYLRFREWVARDE